MLHWLKQHCKNLPYPLLLRGYYADCFAGYWRQYERARQAAGVPRLDDLDLAPWKRSDTLFVLASGPSINRLPPERWQAIRRADSVGFNFWLLHDFVPTYYFYECTSPWAPPGATVDPVASFENALRLFLDQAALRAEAYRNVPKIVMDLVQTAPLHDIIDLPAGFRRHLHAAITLPLAARTDEEFALGLRYLVRKGAFRPSTRIRYLFKHCGTLSTMVAFAVRMGYRRVVLCGVDLSDEDRFYHDTEEFPDQKGAVMYTHLRNTGKKHLLLTRYAWGNRPIDVVLLAMKRYLLDPAGIELYVENPRSELAGRIPVAPASLFAEINQRAGELTPGAATT